MASNEITILGVQFSEDVLEITYSEERQQNDRAALVNQMLLQARDHGETIGIILEELRDLVDAGLVILRDPPLKLSPRERMKRAAAQEAEPGDDDLPPVSAYEDDSEMIEDDLNE